MPKMLAQSGINIVILSGGLNDMAKKRAASLARKSRQSAAAKPQAKRGKAMAKPAAAKAEHAASSDGRSRKGKRYWLVKSEPDAFSIEDLAAEPDQTTHWDGVRNYQARNTLRDEMKIGDEVLFYHSNAAPPGIVGICKVVREGYPDFTAFDPQDKHYDPKSKQAEPRWFMVDVKLVKKFKRELPLTELKETPGLEGMPLLQKGSRLSVQPVSEEHFRLIKKMAAG